MTTSNGYDSRRPFQIILGLLLGLGSIGLVGCENTENTEVQSAVAGTHVSAQSAVEAGRYIAILGGCNDCHTEGYLQSEGDVPEENWLTGSILGWRGPWGTTYPPNLRLRVQEMTEDAWVEQIHTRTALPPMPWMNVNQMAEQDARALYQYLQSLGPAGEHAPAALPPDEEPAGPYLSLIPVNAEPSQ